jgi:hypothetical protein
MAKDIIYLSFLVLLCSRYVESDLFYDALSKVDPCEAYCEKIYPGISGPNVSSALPFLHYIILLLFKSETPSPWH